uniref:Uncharacterized protein n=1 Tax=Phlebotomus papatasi TaxID=29031 RepID=A0A1B0D675_PHLPP
MECALGDYCQKPLGQEDDDNSPGTCQSCGPLMTYNYEQRHCVYCPIYKEKCYNNCCYRIDGYSGYEIRCVNDMCMRCKTNDDDSRCSIQNFQEVTSKFIVAFAIAFSVALTSLIIYRFNFRRRRYTN